MECGSNTSKSRPLIHSDTNYRSVQTEMPRKLLCLRYMEPQKPQLFLMTYFVCPFQIHEFHLIWRYTRQMGYFCVVVKLMMQLQLFKQILI